MDVAGGETLPMTEDESKDIAKPSVLEKPNPDKLPTSARRKNRKYTASHVSSAHVPTYIYGETDPFDTRCTEPKVTSGRETTPKEATHRKTRRSHDGDRKVKPVSGAEDVKLHKAEQPWKPKRLQQQDQTEAGTSPRRTQDIYSTGAHGCDRKVTQVSKHEGVTLHKAKHPWKPRRLKTAKYTDEEVSRHECVTLHKAKHPWKPRRPEPEEFTEKELFMSIRGILNKLTPQKFQHHISGLQMLKINSEQKLNGLVDLVFEKAISEPLYSAVYANMCRYLTMYKVKCEHREGKMVKFRALLSLRCQRESKVWKLTEVTQAYLEKLENENERLKLKSRIEQRNYEMKSKRLGTLRFVGELFKIKLLTDYIIHDMIFKLLKQKDNISLECVCVLLTTVGKELEVDKAKYRIDQYFRQMSKITNEKKCSSTVLCLLLNVMDLRANNWIPRRPEITPKTIDQVHKEVAEERQENDLPSFQSVTSATNAQKGFATVTTKTFKANKKTMNREEPITSEEIKVDKQEDERAVAQKSRGIPMRTIKSGLHEYLVKGTANNNDAISWIDCNVEESVTRGNTFIRTLITDICKHALEKDDIRGCLIDVDKIRDRRDLLRKYLKHNPDLELQALYALQLFVGKRKYPPGNIRGILEVLYGADIISEDGFFKIISPHAVGAVISQEMENGEDSLWLQDIDCFRKKLSKNEKEALAIIFGIQNFHQFSYGRKIVLITDNKPLSLILVCKKGKPMLQHRDFKDGQFSFLHISKKSGIVQQS